MYLIFVHHIVLCDVLSLWFCQKLLNQRR